MGCQAQSALLRFGTGLLQLMTQVGGAFALVVGPPLGIGVGVASQDRVVDERCQPAAHDAVEADAHDGPPGAPGRVCETPEAGGPPLPACVGDS